MFICAWSFALFEEYGAGVGMALSTQQLQLVEQRLANEARSSTLSYVLWFFLGPFGAHRFYIGKVGSGIGMLVLFWLGLFTSWLAIGLVFLIAYGIWWLVDAFLIPGMVDADRRLKRTQIANEIGATSSE